MKLDTTTNTDQNETTTVMTLARRIALSGSQESSFLICDESAIRANSERILGKMAAKPYFDIFCNCNPRVLRLLSDLGYAFRARSKEEIKLGTAAGLRGDQLMLDSPMLVASHLRMAAAKGVAAVAVRSAGDLKKIKKEFPAARLLLTLRAPMSSGRSNSSSYDNASNLFRAAAELGLSISGVAFEISEEEEGEIDYRKQLALTKLLIAVAKSQFGQEVTSVHLGTVMGVEDAERVRNIFAESALEGVILSMSLNDAVISSAFSLYTRIIGKRAVTVGGNASRTFVLNEGVFGHFGRLLHRDLSVPMPTQLLASDKSDTKKTFFCDFLGPSGDDLDVVGLSVPVEGKEMEVGDWIVFPSMGAEVITPANPIKMISLPAQEGLLW
jgi:diaminopimelate decarboxylase